MRVPTLWLCYHVTWALSVHWLVSWLRVELNCNLHHRDECWSLQGRGGGTCAFCECKQRRLVIIHKQLSWPRGQIVNRRVIFAPALLLSYTQVIPNSLHFPFFPSLFRLAGSRWPRWKRWFPRPAWSAWTSRPPWTPRPRWSKLFLHTVSGWVCLSFVLVCLWSVRKFKKKQAGEDGWCNASSLGSMGQSVAAILHHGRRAKISRRLFEATSSLNYCRKSIPTVWTVKVTVPLLPQFKLPHYHWANLAVQSYRVCVCVYDLHPCRLAVLSQHATSSQYPHLN